jgi:hypothetical protein
VLETWKARLNRLVTKLHSCGIYINIPCKYLTEDSVYLQYNVTLYIQKSVSENAQNAVLASKGWKNIKCFWGRTPPDPPTITYGTTSNFLVPAITICHLSTLSIVWSLFVNEDERYVSLAGCNYISPLINLVKLLLYSVLFVSESTVKGFLEKIQNNN